MGYAYEGIPLSSCRFTRRRSTILLPHSREIPSMDRPSSSPRSLPVSPVSSSPFPPSSLAPLPPWPLERAFPRLWPQFSRGVSESGARHERLRAPIVLPVRPYRSQNNAWLTCPRQCIVRVDMAFQPEPYLIHLTRRETRKSPGVESGKVDIALMLDAKPFEPAGQPPYSRHVLSAHIHENPLVLPLEFPFGFLGQPKSPDLALPFLPTSRAGAFPIHHLRHYLPRRLVRHCILSHRLVGLFDTRHQLLDLFGRPEPRSSIFFPGELFLPSVATVCFGALDHGGDLAPLLRVDIVRPQLSAITLEHARCS